MQALTSGQWATDPLFDYTTLLLQADNAANSAQNNTFLDSSTNAFAITRNGNTTQGTFSPFSATGWSNYFDGTTDKLYATVSAAGTGSFTYEAFVYPTAFASNKTIFRTDNSGALDISLLCNASGQLLVYNNGGTLLASTTTGLSLNTWAHVALVRNGTAIEVYINGVASRTGGSGSSSENLTFTQLDIGSRASDGIECWQGYISNARYCKAAVYTSGFTPATSSLTSSSQSATSCQLLTCQSNRFVDNSGNNYTLTTAGDTSVQAFSPFAPQYQYTASVTGGSGYFDGSGDYLTVPAGSAFAYGTGQYTVEAWVYLTTYSAEPRIFAQTASAIEYFTLLVDSTGKVAHGTNAGTSQTVVSSGTLPLNSWVHIAAVREGTGTNQTKLYINGVNDGTGTISGNFTNTTYVPTIGRYTHSASQHVTGYISNFRVVKGSAVYTSNFTPPTAPLTAITNTQLLLNFTNAGIYDGTMKNDLETVGNAQISTSVVKYGSGSMYFDGSGDYLRPNSGNIFNFGTGDFTVEFWLYLNATTAQTFIDCRPGSAGDYILFDYDPTLRLYVGSTTVLSGKSLSTGQWYHIALARSGSTVKYFVNGVQEASATMTTNLLSASNPYIGSNYVPGAYLNGYIDDLRITKGIARYITNFTPPLVALPRQ